MILTVNVPTQPCGTVLFFIAEMTCKTVQMSVCASV